MKKQFKIISSSLLLFTGILPVLLAVFFLYKQQHIRHEMKERLEQQYLQTVVVPVKDFVWIKYKKEILVEDRLFDIKKIQLKDDRYYCTGLFDDDETALNIFFSKTHERSDDKKVPLAAQLFKLLQCLYPTEPARLFFFSDLKQTSYLSFSLILPSPYAKVLTPPPQL